jgi:hypothetical protein
MSLPFEPKFQDCITCKHFLSPKCRQCKVGEHYESKDDDEEPSDNELMAMYGEMFDDD